MELTSALILNLALLLFTGLTFSIRGKLTPKKAGVIVAAYFGAALISNIFVLMQPPGIWPTVFQSILFLKCPSLVTIQPVFCRNQRHLGHLCNICSLCLC